MEKMAIREVSGDQNEFDMLILYLGFQVNRTLLILSNNKYWEVERLSVE